MGRKSSIMRKPADVRDDINEQLDEGRTLDEVLDSLRDRGITDISRSALWRWSKQIERIAAKARRSRMIAEVVTRRLERMPQSRLVQANVESMHGVLMQLIDAAEHEDELTISPRDALDLSRAIAALAQADKANAEKVIRVEEYRDEKEPAAGQAGGLIEIAFVEPKPTAGRAASRSNTDTNGEGAS